MKVEPVCGRERGAAEREAAGEILSEAEGSVVEPVCGRERGAAEREAAGEILSEAEGSVVEPVCGRERGAAEREAAGEILNEVKDPWRSNELNGNRTGTSGLAFDGALVEASLQQRVLNWSEREDPC